MAQPVYGPRLRAIILTLPGLGCLVVLALLAQPVWITRLAFFADHLPSSKLRGLRCLSGR